MKATCDICGKEDMWIEPLVCEYTTEEVKGVCGECMRTLNKHLDDIRRLQRKILFTWMKRFIEALKDKYRRA